MIISVVGVLGSPLLSFALIRYVAQPVRNVGPGMLPTIQDGDRLMINKLTRTYGRGDIVLFHYPRDPTKCFIKRVVALPGDTVEIRSGEVFIGGVLVNEIYVDPDLNQLSNDYGPELVPPDHVFVLGDNRDHSNDSRHWGMLPTRLIYGRYMFRYA